MLINSSFGRFVHDISTPVTMLKMNFDQLKQDEVTVPIYKSNKNLQRIEQGIDELAFLLNMSSNVQTSSVKRSSVIKEMHKIIRVFELKFRKNEICTCLEFEEDFFLTKGIDKFHRIVSNLINNAIEALDCRLQNKQIILRTYRSEVGFVFTVEDNGCGISRENLSKLFSQRFTTKQNGQGLGLIGVRKMLLENFNGIITCNSIQGRGSKFEVILPDPV